MDNSNLNGTVLTVSPPWQGRDGSGGPVTLPRYVDYLSRCGYKVIEGSDGTFWRSGEASSLVRLPSIGRKPIAGNVVRGALLKGPAAVASYLVEPCDGKPANAHLYLCQDRQYTLESLPRNTRNHVRRALRSLDIAWLNPGELMTHGFQAYSDSRTRNGLTDGTKEAFARRYARWFDNPAHHALGAWHSGDLVAFFSVVAVDDWVEIGGHSHKEGMQWNPNNGLIHYLLTHYLAEGRAAVVSYGLSTIQDNTNAEGLHVFKLGVGFDAHPVHRVFCLNPVLRPFATKSCLAAANRLLTVSPGNRWLRKACGALKLIVDGAGGDAD